MTVSISVTAHTDDADKEYEMRNAFQEVVDRFSDEVLYANFSGQHTGQHALKATPAAQNDESPAPVPGTGDATSNETSTTTPVAGGEDTKEA